MEDDRKRKRIELQNIEVNKKKVEERAAPSEEEVEEFFAILRNMQVALKYFEKNGGNIDNILKLKDEDKITIEDGKVDDEKENREGGLLLDLNALPEDSA
ncbi:hypothetical protein Leryth_011498 [Lithospermum erythrorhizon]|uniref:Uncharacterized protein n=1 Tax=Lithospermum erythrorhizon TaxID=34254 RepID=A0AAV3PNA0_LITER|nr:hypothetical protein Leryth_011498 [Lithospermum erythrorhizon]